MINVLAVAVEIEESGGSIDVDPGLGRIALQPAQPLHRDGGLPRPVAGIGIERIERVAAYDPVGLEPEVGLQLLHGCDH